MANRGVRTASVLLLLLCLATLAHCKVASKAKPPIKVEHGEGDTHDAKYDHQAVLGTQEEQEKFETYSREEATEKLAGLVDKMDLDQDGFVSRTELRSWIMNSFKTLHKEDLEHTMQVVDEDNDGAVTWEEYLHSQHGYHQNELKEEREKDNATNANANDYETIDDDKKRFEAADADHNGVLSMYEYDAFENPEESDVMRDYEATQTLSNYDGDQDGAINLQEFMVSEGHDATEEEEALKDFKTYDENNDGLLDRREIANWVLPKDDSTAESETDHLLTETDGDKDGKLSKEEILEHYDLWVGSHATNYGEHLHDPSEL